MKSSKQTINHEINRNEANFIEWLLDNEKYERIASKADVKKKIIELSSPDWLKSSHWFAKYCRRLAHWPEFAFYGH